MERLPTLVLIAHSEPIQPISHTSSQINSSGFGNLDAVKMLFHQLQTSTKCNLPTVLIAQPHLTSISEQLLPGNCIINIGEKNASGASHQLANFVSTGVANSADASGWLILPINIITKSTTIQKLASRLSQQSAVYPTYRQIRGFPIGFSSEFFSELIQLKTNHDFNRLLRRYPAMGIDVDDPGVIPNSLCLMPQEAAQNQSVLHAH